MPKKDIDYSRTIIYKISCNDAKITDCYIGRTTDIYKRRCEHKHYSTTDNICKSRAGLYSFIKANGGWDNFTVAVIEQKECKTKDDALSLLLQHISKNNATLNPPLPGKRTRKPNDPEQRRIYMQKYSFEHRDRVNLYKRNCYYRKQLQKLNDENGPIPISGSGPI